MLVFRTVCLIRPNWMKFKFGTITENEGTDYTSWMLARAASHNHNISHMKRNLVKDRYSIHRLTNVEFICQVVNFQHRYKLRMNEKILLLAQLNHILQVMKKNKLNFTELKTLMIRIFEDLKDPDDLPCLGTFMNTLAWMGQFSEDIWITFVDALLAKKFDEDYDELFGIAIALQMYRKNLILQQDYFTITSDKVIPQIPIIYRNSLNVLRQYVTYNLYNLKECRLLFQALYGAHINEGFFWNSIKDWFNIFIKEQLNQKEMDEFFIINEGSVEKILHDHGIIRPRPILQELTHIVFILSEFGFLSWRFIEFAQDIILYSMQNGSSLFHRFLELERNQSEANKAKENSEGVNLNQHLENMQFFNEEERSNVKKMETKYKLIFLNPIDLKNESLIYFLVVLARAYTPKQSKEKEHETNIYDKKEEVYLDPRITKWLLLRLVKPEMRYTIKELLFITDCEPFLKQKSQISLEKFVIEKLKNLRDLECSFSEMEKIMHFVPYQYFEVLTPSLKYFLVRNHPSEVYKLIKHIEKNEWISRLVEVMMTLPKVVNGHYKYYSFEENCYFLYLLLKNNMYWENSEVEKFEFEGQMQKLKESIKVVTYSRGFKLSLNSYFHKIMEYIDVVEFFEGGTV